VNGAKNAGILAAKILGASDPKIRAKIAAYKKRMRNDVLAKAKRLEKKGYKRYAI
jgi:5-(carboxyamino)imidazole ribonucleotide mutase